MKIQSLNRMQQTTVIVGLIILSIGFGSHFLIPGTSRSGLIVQVEGGETVTRSISLDLADVDYYFGIDMLPPDQSTESNVTVFLLDASNYDLYQSGTPINSVDTLLVIDDSSPAQYESRVTDKLEFYIVFQNNGANSTLWSYYYAVIPSTYYPTLIVGFSGLFVLLAGLGWIFSGWKRYFVVGLSVNVVLFFIRIFTLSTYILGLPDIFWDLIHTEMYNDYQYFYLAWVPNMVEGAWPYSDALYYYIYPPLWIYTVSMLGNVPSWLPGLMLFTFNVATGPLVYEITSRITQDEKRAIVAMLIYLLNPFTLIYGSFMWLNPTPFVFFAVLSFYFALEKKETHSIVAIALATLYKQYAVVLFPIVVIMFIKQRSHTGIFSKLKEFLRHSFVYCVVIGLVSLPFLIISPVDYLNRMIFWNTGTYDRLTYFIPGSWMPVHANTFFLWLGFPSWFTDTIALLLINYVFLILCAIIVYGTFTMMGTPFDDMQYDKERFRNLFVHALVWSFVAILCIQLFYPRGAYKFYLLALAPFFAILFDYDAFTERMSIPFKFQKKHLFHIVMSWIVFLFYRFAYFWVLALWMGIVLWKSGDLKRIQDNLVAVLTLSFIRRPGFSDLDELEEIYSD